jgi:hypothetical protein
VIAPTLRLTAETIDAVRSTVRVEDVIAERIVLRRSGKVLVGSCPWHKSRSRRSFVVYPDRQSWRCWGCAVGGDVFDFLGRYAGASFPATVKLLAAHSGIELDGEVPQEATETLSARTELAQVEKEISELLEAEYMRVARELDKLNRIFARASFRLAELSTGARERFPDEAGWCWLALSWLGDATRRADAEYMLLAFGKQSDREQFVISDALGRTAIIDAFLEAE